MWTKAYKLLIGCYDKTFLSVCDNKYSIKYEIGKEHYPLPNSLGLFVFDTLKNAKAVNYGSVIHECVVFNAKPIEYIGDLHGIDEFYISKGKSCIMRPPKGTLVCEKLILLPENFSIWP